MMLVAGSGAPKQYLASPPPSEIPPLARLFERVQLISLIWRGSATSAKMAPPQPLPVKLAEAPSARFPSNVQWIAVKLPTAQMPPPTPSPPMHMSLHCGLTASPPNARFRVNVQFCSTVTPALYNPPPNP